MSRMTELANWIREHDEFAVISHLHPDGDTLGSVSALIGALKLMGKKAYPWCRDKVPHMYAFMPGMDEFRSDDDVPFEPKALIFVDISTKERAGHEASRFDSVENTAVLDHHETNPFFGTDVNVVDPDAPATGELMLELIEELGVPFTKEIAEDLYMAIVCDTNNFSIQSVNADTFRKMTKIADTGINIQQLCRKLIRMRSASRTLLLGKALNAMKFTCGGKIAYSAVSRAMFDEAGADDEDTEGIVTVLNDTEGVEIAILATELKNGRTKFSLRAAGDCSVSELAVRFGGGGHEKAAGITMDEKLDKALSLVLTEAEKLV